MAEGKIKDDDMHDILLDEVQLLGEFESVLNSLIRMRNVDVYIGPVRKTTFIVEKCDYGHGTQKIYEK